MTYGRYELGMDSHLEEMYEERYEIPDYDQFEENQLALDRMYDEYYDDEDEFYDSDEYDDPA